jgi:predicted HD phosphohydrolase
MERAHRFDHADDLIEHLRVLGRTVSVEDPALTELDHGLQTAALLEQVAPHDLELQVAGLVHDLAHPWDGPGQPRHAGMGAIAVTSLLGHRVADLIRSHVPAKRYLVATRPHYAALLSPDSVMTLAAQGGPMDGPEVAAFEAQPGHEAMVELRVADDAAKVVGAQVPPLEHWLRAIHLVAAAEHFRQHGWALVDELTADDTADLRRWVTEVSDWPEGEGDWLHHREQTDHGPRLCRTENFVPFHAGLGNLLRTRLAATASALLGEPAVLYKEKVNYKLAGGAGYSPHQDAPAYPFIDTHVSCMVAVDDATTENGCLEVVDAMHHDLLPMNERGCIIDELAATMTWTPVPLRAGQTLWFHSRTPHRSGANHSSHDRRALYPTYNAARHGDLRDDYYREKVERFRTMAPGQHVTVSLIGDFEGRPVTE